MLIDKKTKQEIKIGDVVETFHGEQAVVTDIADLVYIKNESGIPKLPYGVYMGVIGAEWINPKPYYIFKAGSWWVFKYREQCIGFRQSIKDGAYNSQLEPRKTILTEVGYL